jgi:integrase
MSAKQSAATRITKRTVDTAALSDGRYIIWDSELRGFGVRVEPAGTKTYLVRYRPKGHGASAPKRFVTIGRHGTLTTDEARTQARIVLGKVAQGEDPAAEAIRSKGAKTLGEIAKVFLEQHVAAKRKPRTEEHYRYILESIVLPRFERRRAESITRADFSQAHYELRETPANANRMLAVVSSLYSFAALNGFVPERCNPVRGIEKYPEQGRERYLTTDELRRLGDALALAETDGIPWSVEPDAPLSKHLPTQPENRLVRIDLYAAAAIRLLLLTGCRKSEILNLEWSHVDFDRGLLLLPDSKTGKKIVVLSGAAREVLTSLPRKIDVVGSRHVGNRYVIAGELPDQRRADLKRPWKLVSERAGLTGVRLHDLRHTFAATGAGASLGLPIIGKLLGHTQAQTTARYAHLDAEPMRHAADLISDKISSALTFTSRRNPTSQPA